MDLAVIAINFNRTSFSRDWFRSDRCGTEETRRICRRGQRSARLQVNHFRLSARQNKAIAASQTSNDEVDGAESDVSDLWAVYSVYAYYVDQYFSQDRLHLSYKRTSRISEFDDEPISVQRPQGGLLDGCALQHHERCPRLDFAPSGSSAFGSISGYC